MEDIMKDIVVKHIADLLDCHLEEDEGLKKCRKKFLLLFDKLKKKLADSKKKSKLIDEVGKAMNDYICKYGEAAYCLGFRNGMEEMPCMSVEDMTHLICIMDAYRELNIAFCGEEMMLGFNEGCIGALSRIYKVIAHNVCAEMRENDFAKEDEILLDTSLTPEERAKKLLGK